MLLRQSNWVARQQAEAESKVDLDDIPERSDSEDAKETFDYGDLKPLDPALVDYLQRCPSDEWDEYFSYADEEEIVQRAREDPNVFMEYCFRDKDGEMWKQQDFHREWQGMIPTASESKLMTMGQEVLAYTSDGKPVMDMDGNHMRKSQTSLIVAPREHAKSTQVPVGRTIWELGKNCNLRARIVTANPELAKDILHEIADNIEKNGRIKRVFPDLVPDYDAGWTKYAIRIKRDAVGIKDPSVEAVSVFSTGAGKRTDWLLFDDVVDFRNAISQPSLRPMVKRSVGEVWLSTMPPDGRCVYTATPWHEDDATHQFRDSPGWSVWWTPAISERTGPDGKPTIRVLWPNKWSLVALNNKKSQIGEREFARQYLLMTLSDDEATFPQMALDRCLDPIRGTFGAHVDDKWARVAGLDLSASMRQRGAFNVLFTFAIEPTTGRLIPYHMVRGKFDFAKFVDLIVELAPVMRWEMLMVENNGYQQAMVSTLEQKRLTGFINVESFRTGANKADPEVGLPALAAVFNAGGFSIPDKNDHDVDCTCDLCTWVMELRGHPTAKYSDTVMATWFAHRAAVQVGMNFIDGYTVYTESELPQKKRAIESDELELIVPGVRQLPSLYTAQDIERLLFKGAFDGDPKSY